MAVLLPIVVLFALPGQSSCVALADHEARLFPHYSAGKPEGVKLVGVKADGTLYEFGLRSGDVVRAMNDEETATAAAALDAILVVGTGAPVTIHVERGGKPLSIERVTGEPPAGWSEQSAPCELDDPRFAYSVGEPAPVDPWGSASSEGTPACDALPQVRTFSLDELQAMFEGPVDRSAVVYPVERDGALVGMRLRGVRSGSRLAGIGFCDRDLIRSVNGIVADPQHAEEIRRATIGAHEIVLRIRRGDVEGELKFLIR
jgi:hypothetical protein